MHNDNVPPSPNTKATFGIQILNLVELVSCTGEINLPSKYRIREKGKFKYYSRAFREVIKKENVYVELQDQ